MRRAAALSDCGRYRFTLVREWDPRPMLVVVMFNPSSADALVDDPTISLLCYLASWNGFGGVTVVNLCPLRCSDPSPAKDWLRDTANASRIIENRRHIEDIVAKAPDILVAWGALAAGCEDVIVHVIRAIRFARPDARLWSLGLTKDGHPIHPLARGKMKVEKTRRFVEFAWI